jgi:hypothetical protein
MRARRNISLYLTVTRSSIMVTLCYKATLVCILREDKVRQGEDSNA